MPIDLSESPSPRNSPSPQRDLTTDEIKAIAMRELDFMAEAGIRPTVLEWQAWSPEFQEHWLEAVGRVRAIEMSVFCKMFLDALHGNPSAIEDAVMGELPDEAQDAMRRDRLIAEAMQEVIRG